MPKKLASIPSGQENRRFKCIVYKTNKIYYEISTIYECVEKKIDDYKAVIPE